MAYYFEETKPFWIKRLSDVVDESTIQMLLQGFGHELNFPLVIIEPNTKPYLKDKKLHRIDPSNPLEYHSEFCESIKSTKKGGGECKRSTYEIAKRLYKKQSFDGTKPEFCWMGLRKYFIPLSVNRVPVATLVCGGFQLDSKEDRKRLVQGLERCAELGLDSKQLEKLAKESQFIFSPEEMDKTRSKLESFRKSLESFMEYYYQAKTTEREWEFLQEIEAMFNLVYKPRPTEEKLWKRMKWILNRINQFCGFESSCFFINNDETAERLILKSQVPEGIYSNASLIMDDDFRKIMNEKKEYFYDAGNAIEKASIPQQVINLLGRDARVIGTFPLDLRDRKAFLIFKNRKRVPKEDRWRGEGYVSIYLRNFSNLMAGVLINHLRSHLSTIKLYEAEEERQDFIARTFHTINSYMDTLRVRGTSLDRALEKSPVDFKKVFIIAQEIDEYLQGLENKTKTLYYYMLSGEIEFRFDKSFSLINLLERCKDRFYFFAKNRGIEIKIEEEYKVPPALGDQEKLDVAFSNILHNAIKYSHLNKDIYIRLKQKRDEKCLILFNNFGFGVPADEKERIFLAFKRSRVKDPRRPIPGAGLGLTMSQEIIKAHGGNIYVASKKEGREYSLNELSDPRSWEGFNTTFVVTLPILAERRKQND